MSVGHKLPHLARRFQGDPVAPQPEQQQPQANPVPWGQNTQPQQTQPFPGRAETAPSPVNQPQQPAANPQTKKETPATPAQPAPAGPKTLRKASSQKIDPEQIPRPIVTSSESIQPKQWNANKEGNAPPPTYSIFEVNDQGCAGPRYVRCTLNTIGNDPASVNESNIPLAALIQPLAEVVGKEEGVSLVDYADLGPFRCVRCKAYVNPFFQFIDGGNSAICNLCKMNNKVPPHYYCPLDERGLRRDTAERPELSKGVYEFVAPKEYHSREVVTPSIVILLEASHMSYSLGIFSQVISSLQVLVDYLPNPEKTDICLITYGASINLLVPPTDLANEPQMYSITDPDEPEIPFPWQKLLLNAAKDRERIDYVLRKTTEFYDQMFSEQKDTSHQHHQPGYLAPSLGGALLTAQSLLAVKGGKIVTFASTFSVNGAGKMKPRNDYKLYNTEKEKGLYEPQTQFYADLGYKMQQQRVGLDLFIFNSDYFDIPTVSPAATLTGGNVYYYSLYSGDTDGEKLHYEISRVLTRYQGFDVVMKLRTSQGLSVIESITSGSKRPTSELEFAVLDADKSLTFALKQDDKIADQDAHLQLAVLYTNPSGERVLRVINQALHVVNDISMVFRSADTEAIPLYLLRKALSSLPTAPTKQIHEALQTNLVNILYSYRTHCASSSSPGQLILPESLKLLPLYIFSAYNKAKLRSQKLQPHADHRYYEFIKCVDRPPVFYLTYLYPRFYPVHTIPTLQQANIPGDQVEDRICVPATCPARQDKIEAHGAYIVDNSEYLQLLVAKSENTELFQQLFGVGTFAEVMSSVSGLPQIPENDLNTRVNAIIDQIRRNKNTVYQSLKVVPIAPEQINLEVAGLFVEDEYADSETYADYLCLVHKSIQQKYT